MSQSSSQPLIWQNAAGRKPAGFVPVEVLGVQPYRGGLFGLGRSPSIEGGGADATDVKGWRLQEGGMVTVRASSFDIPATVVKGARVVLGLVDERHVICFLAPPDSVSDGDLADWATRQPCP